MGDNVSQSPALQKLHDNPELVPNQVTVVHLHYILMVIVPHDHNLSGIKKTIIYNKAAKTQDMQLFH